MTDADMLCRAILTYPAEDAPRLVYADWLAEHGQEDRGELIRVQCELAMMGCSLADKHGGQWFHNCKRDGHGTTVAIMDGFPCEELRYREQELLLAPAGQFDIDTTAIWPIVVRRGFLAELTCTWADWLKHEIALFWHPTQTLECPQCHGTTRLQGWHEDEGDYPCGCDNAGRIPREMPATAQPIEKVTLTTFDFVPEFYNEWGFRRHPEDAENRVNIWRCDRWPGVEFAMPEREPAEERERRNRAAFPTTTISGW